MENFITEASDFYLQLDSIFNEACFSMPVLSAAGLEEITAELKGKMRQELSGRSSEDLEFLMFNVIPMLKNLGAGCSRPRTSISDRRLIVTAVSEFEIWTCQTLARTIIAA